MFLCVRKTWHRFKTNIQPLVDISSWNEYHIPSILGPLALKNQNIYAYQVTRQNHYIVYFDSLKGDNTQLTYNYEISQ